MATSREMATYIGTTRQRDKEIALTKLVQGVYKFHMQIYITIIKIEFPLEKYRAKDISSIN